MWDNSLLIFSTRFHFIHLCKMNAEPRNEISVYCGSKSCRKKRIRTFVYEYAKRTHKKEKQLSMKIEKSIWPNEQTAVVVKMSICLTIGSSLPMSKWVTFVSTWALNIGSEIIQFYAENLNNLMKGRGAKEQTNSEIGSLHSPNDMVSDWLRHFEWQQKLTVSQNHSAKTEIKPYSK